MENGQGLQSSHTASPVLKQRPRRVPMGWGLPLGRAIARKILVWCIAHAMWGLGNEE